MAYADLLKDRRWQQKRLEVLQAAQMTCQRCESSDPSVPLHVHHKRYRRGAKPWEYENSELEALCETCHEEVSVIFKRLDAAVEAIKLHTDTAAASEALGLLEACAAPNAKVLVLNFEHACGIAIGCGGGVTGDDVRCSVDENGCVVPVDVLIGKPSAEKK